MVANLDAAQQALFAQRHLDKPNETPLCSTFTSIFHNKGCNTINDSTKQRQDPCKEQKQPEKKVAKQVTLMIMSKSMPGMVCLTTMVGCC